MQREGDQEPFSEVLQRGWMGALKGVSGALDFTPLGLRPQLIPAAALCSLFLFQGDPSALSSDFPTLGPMKFPGCVKLSPFKSGPTPNHMDLTVSLSPFFIPREGVASISFLF